MLQTGKVGLADDRQVVSVQIPEKQTKGDERIRGQEVDRSRIRGSEAGVAGMTQ